MSYKVDVDFSPAYELLLSLFVLMDSPSVKFFDLGRNWKGDVKKRLSPELLTAIEESRAEPPAVPPWGFVWECPDKGDVEGFLGWYEAMPLDEMYERLLPLGLRTRVARPSDLAVPRERGLKVLAGWNEQYFRHLDPAILAGLKTDAATKKALAATMESGELVELATSGVQYDPAPDFTRLVLVPQHHFVPWNVHDTYASTVFDLYPAEILPPEPGHIPRALLRLTSALADESRLLILRFLAEGPRNFTEVVKFSGLAKSTVHHHLVALRAAGLVRVHSTAVSADRYSLRPGALEQSGVRLAAFVKNE